MEVTRNTYDPAAPFQKIPFAARTIGCSQHFLREGCKKGIVPHAMSGNTYLINVGMTIEMLNEESKQSTKQ